MRTLTLLGLIAGSLATLSACDVEGGTPANRIGDADGQLGPWFMSAHPCVGNRTDVMWFDDEYTGFVGCGSTTSGYGMYETRDGGATWAATPASPGVLASMRVDSISRASDDLLYIGGTGDNGIRVITLDDSSDAVGEFYLKPSSGAQSWQTYQVGTFRITDTGRAVSESLTGSDVMYWSSPSATPVNGYGWWNAAGVEGSGAQILDLEIYGDRFYGVGSTISQPPYFFYEPAGGMGSEFKMEAIKLSGSGLNAFIGEVWDIAIDSAGDMILSGVNESTNTGVLWYNEGDPTVASSWVMYDITPIVPDFPTNRTRFYGGCREGDLMVAVGDWSQEEEALAVVSTDGGASWNLYGPPGTGADTVGPLSKCQIFGEYVYITGADGFFGVLDTTGL
ncbi:MAG: hypothetical protein JXX28_15905 [Deltaproteobacteria bacterium]|nr:hypothetical protein [Deltaproteobacteria bacterium]